MGSDQIATIHPAVREVFEAPDRDAWCVTFQVSLDPGRWVQITTDSVNMAYPYDESPDLLLPRTGAAGFAKLVLEEWESDSYATFSSSEDLSTMDLARLVDRLFISVLQCTDPDYPLDVEIFRTALASP